MPERVSKHTELIAQLESAATRDEAVAALEAMDIFIDCTNAGVPFQDALTAIYISGLSHAIESRKT